jgi:FKBP-type peptidyl-prolyl cis-trans isomerase FkpA
MKQFLYVVSAVLLLSGCSESFKKGEKGIEYKIISAGNGKKIAYGNFMQIHITQFYKDGKKDTILNDSRTGGMPQLIPLDSTNLPQEFFKILNQVKSGDSVVMRIKTDSLIKNSPQGLPPFMKKGQYFYYTVKVLNIFETQEQAQNANKVAYEAKMRADSITAIAQPAKDDKIIADYLTKNNIKATKTALGTYVEIIQQGSGPLIDSTVSVKVNYIGKTLDGKAFDSNTDPQFNHVQPFVVSMKIDPATGQGSVIKGWIDGLSLLNKGAKARFYIPSQLAYGTQGAGAAIKPNEVLMFDIEVVDVLSKEQVMAEAKKEQMQAMQMQAMQKKFMDSMKKAQADTANKKK